MELLVVTLASLFAGFVDSIVGGGGLILVPALFATFPQAHPATLFGTNKGASVWGTGMATFQYSRRVQMRWQALAALVPLAELPADDRTVASPLLHDERGPALRLLAGDRALQDAAARTIGPQGADARLGDTQRRIVEAFIRRADTVDGDRGSVAGRVDMAAYGAWLEAELGLSGMAAPARQP